jgi:acyl carrier protein
MASEVRYGIDAVRDWLVKKHPERETIGADEDLIEARVVDSLSFVEFLFVIEEASGTEIDQENIDLEKFRTLAAIENTYFS